LRRERSEACLSQAGGPLCFPLLLAFIIAFISVHLRSSVFICGQFEFTFESDFAFRGHPDDESPPLAFKIK